MKIPYTIKITGIDWDTSDTDGDIPSLPTSVEETVRFDINEIDYEADIEARIANHLSDKYGFTVNSFNYLVGKGEIVVPINIPNVVA